MRNGRVAKDLADASHPPENSAAIPYLIWVLRKNSFLFIELVAAF
jgi:hypothetical protein